jgi:hypothetical protein
LNIYIYQEAKTEAVDDIDDYGNGSELTVAEVSSKCLSDEVHRQAKDAAEDGGGNYVPKHL